MPRFPLRYAVAAILAVASTGIARAQTYPVKPVRIVVPFAPGGGTDVIARHLATGLSESLKRQFIVENRAGANAIVGTEFVARAAADGYTLLFVSSPHSVNPGMYAKLPYDTLRDFAPVSEIASSPYFLVTHPSLPVRNVKDLIALAKKQPDQIHYGSGGSGSSAHLSAELFNQMAGVPGYRSDAVLGMLAPARTPRAIIDTLNAESHKVMRQPESIEAMRRMAVDITLSTPEEFGRLIESEISRWSKLIRALNLKPL